MTLDPRLSLQRALLGSVSPSLRGVAYSASVSTIRVVFYFDGSITSDDHADMTTVIAEVAADFPASVVFEDDMVRLDVPDPLPFHDSWVYRRRE